MSTISTSQTQKSRRLLLSAYWLVFSILALAFVALVALAPSPQYFTTNQFNPDAIQASFWFGFSLAIALTCSIGAVFVKRLVWYIVPTIYTAAIIFTAIVAPTSIVHTGYGQAMLGLLTSIPWLLVWLSIGIMWITSWSISKDIAKSWPTTTTRKR